MNRPQQAMTMRSCSRAYPAQFSLFASRGQTPIELFLHPEKKELAHATHDADLNQETHHVVVRLASARRGPRKRKAKQYPKNYEGNDTIKKRDKNKK
jgi:hypothetical protein